MGELQRIRAFLDDVRRRLLWREALTWGAAGGAALLTVLLLLAFSAARVGPGSFWRPMTTLAAIACAAVAVGFGVWRPRRSLRSPPQTARLVARLNPGLRALSGDIISAIEFGEAKFSEAKFGEADPLGTTPAQPTQSPSAETRRGANWFGSTDSRTPRPAALPAPLLTSQALARAFQGTVAEALRPFSAEALVSFRPAIQSGATLLLAIAILVGLTLASPEGVRRGLTLLLHRPSLFEGSLVSAVPIVGDVRITYEYPPYTGLPVRVVDGSTGDVVAVRGTRVTIETAPLHTSRRAAFLMGESGEGPEVPLHLAKGIITGHLTLRESGNFRFWLQPLIGRALREERSHRIEVEPDRPPRVEIQGPADRLDLASPRPVEIGYSASDDFGLGAIDLVYRIDEAPEQRLPLKDAHGAKSAQGRLLWNPARDNLLSVGARVAYHIEARDGDQVSGAKVGLSRTLYIIIARPQESADDRLDRQREILENLTGDLADRLEIPVSGAGRSPTSPSGSGGGVGPSATTVSAAPASIDIRWAATLNAHEAEEAHITLLGRLLDDDRRQGILGKALRSQLAAIAERLGKLLRDERAIMARSTALGRGFPQRGVGGANPRNLTSALAQLSRQEPAHVAELEKDVLLIDDLVGRQRLEELASIGRELTDAHKRLEDLLSRYAATRDEALKRQLERELRELRARIADLAQKIANLKSRNEVSDEWRNLPDTRAIAERARKLDELLGQGDPSAISKALSELGRDLRGLRQMLDENAEGFGEERFPQENRVISDLMKRIGDLEGDERSLAGETKGLSDKQEAEIEKRLHGQLAEWTRKETEKVEQLRQSLGEIRTGDPESPLTEEVERARESAKQLRRLLGERDLAEAKEEADRAAQSLDRAAGHAELAAAAQRKKKGSQDKQNQQEAKSEIAESLSGARALAREIADEVQQFLPKPEETLGPTERDSARGQADRQSAIGDRADEATREAGRRLGQVPGLEQAQEDLRAAAEQMRQAASHLRKSEAKQAGSAERNAAERLAKLRDSLQERSMGGAKQQRDPVRIPGADESSAPRAWRQELLDAMKEHAPEHFRDDVRRYYEELVK